MCFSFSYHKLYNVIMFDRVQVIPVVLSYWFLQAFCSLILYLFIYIWKLAQFLKIILLIEFALAVI